MKHGKKYLSAVQKIEQGKFYTLEEAAKLVLDTSIVKFDGSIEVHMKLGIDPKQAEEQIRSTVSLPHGTGRTVRVVAFVSDEKVKDAMGAGALEAGNTDLIEKIEKGWLDFDVAVATPDMMKDLAKIARVLGQAGLMPNPKSGTVTTDIVRTVDEIRKGQVEFRNDKLANLHNVIGKVSFGSEKLLENIRAYLKAVLEKKPEKMKGNYVLSITLASTMGPGIKVELADALKA